MELKKYLSPFLIFAVLAIAIIFSWFRQGLIYGGGDVGLTTYNPARIAEVISKIWWEDTAPGFPRPQGLASLPTELMLSVLQHLGFPDFAIQASLFGILLFAMGLGMYFLVLEMVGVEKKATAYLAAFFYLINPYMMVQVWHRFIHSTFFLAAGLPFLLLFWKRWITKRDFQSLTFFILFNFLFSFMFSTMAYLVTVWVLFFYFVLFEVFIPWRGSKNLLSVTGKFLFGFILWMLTNAWWIMPVLLVSPSLLSTQHSIISSILTLTAISHQAMIPYSLASLNPFYLFSQKELGEVFNHPLFLFIPWIFVTFIFLGIYSSVKKRSLVFFTGLFLIAVFFAKGIAMPFGAPFLFGFSKSFVIGVLRNPFEKMGILIPFAGSILFAVGFISSWDIFRRKKMLLGSGFLILALGLVFGIYHWPFWSGKLFGTLDKPNFVEIPSYYSQANDWIKSQHQEGNILHLPVLVSEGLTYRWKYGYSGVDSSTDFFTSNPSISMGFNQFYIDNALGALDLMNEVTPEEQEKIKSILRAFNVRFLVLHYDIDWQKSRTKDPVKVAQKLDSLTFLRKQGDFGSLAIYEVKDEDYLSKLYTTGDVDYLIGLNEDTPNFKSSWSWYVRSDTSRLAISEIPDSSVAQIVLLPKKVVSFYPSGQLSADDAIRQLPTVKALPNSLFYNLIRLKEKIQLKEIKNSLSNLELLFAGKRLVEAYYLTVQSPSFSISSVIRDYIKILPIAMDKLDKITRATTINKEVPAEVKNILNSHLTVLQELINRASEKDKDILIEAENLLEKLKIGQGISTVYKQDASDAENLARQVFRYEVPIKGQYELLVASSKAATVYKDNLRTLDFQINDRKEKRSAEEKSSFLSFGFIDLDKGEYEISYPRINSENLFRGFPEGQESLRITSSKHESKNFEINPEPYDPSGTYAIVFDFLVEKGNDPVVRIVDDSDPVDLIGFDPDGAVQRVYQYNEQVREDPYNKSWREFVYYLEPRGNSSRLTFQIEAVPWNDCKVHLAGQAILCKKPEIRQKYERPTTIVIKNLKVYRVFTNPLFLRSKKEANVAAEIANIKYSKPKLLTYEGSFQINKPGYFVFSETFDKGWNLQLSSEGLKSFKPTSHILANMYANAWYIEKAGQYQFKLEYQPQKYFNIGLYIGISSFATLLVLTVAKYLGKYVFKKEL